MNFRKRHFRHEATDTQQDNGRRAALAKLGALGMAGFFATGGAKAAGALAEGENGSATAAPASAAVSPGSCILIPEETAGPYPLLAMLSNVAMTRRDIREGKTGIPLTLNLRLQDIRDACKPLANAAVYIWHCDRDGAYSGYSNEDNGNHAGETFLRGIQISDASGLVSFTTIFPGWYPGRVSHIHFQVYLNNNRGATAVATSQLTFPQDVIDAVYDTPLYRGRGRNTSVRDYRDDGVFSDGADYQIAAMTRGPALQLEASLAVGITK